MSADSPENCYGDGKFVRQLIEKGVNLKPVTVDGPVFSRLLENEPSNEKTIDVPDGWVNFYRVDDYAVTGYFYIDKPVTALAFTAGSNKII